MLICCCYAPHLQVKGIADKVQQDAVSAVQPYLPIQPVLPGPVLPVVAIAPAPAVSKLVYAIAVVKPFAAVGLDSAIFCAGCFCNGSSLQVSHSCMLVVNKAHT